MQTQGNHEEVETGDEATDQPGGDFVDAADEVRDSQSELDADGADEEGGQGYQNHDGEHGHEDHVQHGGDDLLQEALQGGQQGCGEEGREDLAGVVHDVQGQVETQEGDADDAVYRDVCKTLEGAGHEGCGDSRTDPHVGAQALSCGCAQHDGHELQD